MTICFLSGISAGVKQKMGKSIFLQWKPGPLGRSEIDDFAGISNEENPEA
jgi:hypothetical protein